MGSCKDLRKHLLTALVPRQYLLALTLTTIAIIVIIIVLGSGKTILGTEVQMSARNVVTSPRIYK